MYYIKKFFLFTVLVGMLTGCGLATEEEIYNHLEKAVSLETVFEEQQQPLVELETKEQNLYEKIIQLGMSEFDEIKVLSKQALAIIDEREARIEKEKESINASEQEFLLIESKVEKLKETGVKQKAEELLNAMKNRYETYDLLYGHYKEAILLDRQLYDMFQQEDLTLQQLEEQINKINEMYDNIVKANEKFNELTDTYNVKKREFYEAAGLDVVFNNNETSGTSSNNVEQQEGNSPAK